jgi:hypothetical protein
VAIALLRIGKEQRQIIRDGLVDPLVAIRTPADDIAPPLMSDFVNRNEIGEMLLTDVGKSGTVLGLRGQVRVSGKVQ